mmetsp:Transcript_126651/g.300933  ORF Transcript_126651/g.300933 Transcript_126651/m.300933 type:complete len:407 (+) Transcript_126651:721-1941(+)
MFHAVVELLHLAQPGSFSPKSSERVGHRQRDWVLRHIQVFFSLEDCIQACDHSATNIRPRMHLEVRLVADNQSLQSRVVHRVVPDGETFLQVAHVCLVDLVEAVPAMLVAGIGALNEAPITQPDDDVDVPLPGPIQEGPVTVVQVVAVHPERVHAHGRQDVQISTPPAVPHRSSDVRHEVVVREQNFSGLQRRRAVGDALHGVLAGGSVGRLRVDIVPEHAWLWTQRRIHEMLVALELLEAGSSRLKLRPPLGMLIDPVVHGPGHSSPALIATLRSLARHGLVDFAAAADPSLLRGSNNSVHSVCPVAFAFGRRRGRRRLRLLRGLRLFRNRLLGRLSRRGVGSRGLGHGGRRWLFRVLVKNAGSFEIRTAVAELLAFRGALAGMVVDVFGPTAELCAGRLCQHLR